MRTASVRFGRSPLLALLLLAVAGLAPVRAAHAQESVEALLGKSYDEADAREELQHLAQSHREQQARGALLSAERCLAKKGLLESYLSVCEQRAKMESSRREIQRRVDEERASGNEQLARMLEQALANLEPSLSQLQGISGMSVEYGGRFQPLSWDVQGMDPGRREAYVRLLRETSQWLTEIRPRTAATEHEAIDRLQVQMETVLANVESRPAAAAEAVAAMRTWIQEETGQPNVANAAQGEAASSATAPRVLDASTVDPRYKQWYGGYGQLSIEADRLEQGGQFVEAARVRARIAYGFMAYGSLSTQAEHQGKVDHLTALLQQQRNQGNGGVVRDLEQRLAQEQRALDTARLVGLIATDEPAVRSPLFAAFTDLRLSYGDNRHRNELFRNLRQARHKLYAGATHADSHADDVAMGFELVGKLDRVLGLLHDGAWNEVGAGELAEAQDILDAIWAETLGAGEPVTARAEPGAAGGEAGARAAHRPRVLELPAAYRDLDAQGLFDVMTKLKRVVEQMSVPRTPREAAYKWNCEAMARYLALFYVQRQQVESVESAIAEIEESVAEDEALGLDASTARNQLAIYREQLAGIAGPLTFEDFAATRGRGTLAVYLTDLPHGESGELVAQRLVLFQDELVRRVRQGAYDAVPETKAWVAARSREAGEIAKLLEAGEVERARERCEAIWADVLRQAEADPRESLALEGSREARTLELPLLSFPRISLGEVEALPESAFVSEVSINRRGDAAFVIEGRTRHRQLFFRSVEGAVVRLYPARDEKRPGQALLHHLADDGTVTWTLQRDPRDSTLKMTRAGRDVAAFPGASFLAADDGFIAYTQSNNPSTGGGGAVGALFMGRPEEPRKVVGIGQLLPELGPDIEISHTRFPPRTMAGQFMLAELEFHGTGAPSGKGIWLVSPDGMELVGYDRMELPDGSRFDSRRSDAQITAAGRVTFSSSASRGVSVHWIQEGGRRWRLDPQGLPEGATILMARAFDDGRVLLQVSDQRNRPMMYLGTAERVELWDRHAGAIPRLALMTSAGMYHYEERAELGSNELGTWIGTLDRVHLMLHPDDRLPAPDGRDATSVKVNHVSPHGHLVVTATYPAILGEKNREAGYFLVLSPLAESDADTALGSAQAQPASSPSAEAPEASDDSQAPAARQPSPVDPDPATVSDMDPDDAPDTDPATTGAAPEALRGKTYSATLPTSAGQASFEVVFNRDGSLDLMDLDSFDEFEGRWSTRGRELLLVTPGSPFALPSAPVKGGRRFTGTLELGSNGTFRWICGDRTFEFRENK